LQEKLAESGDLQQQTKKKQKHLTVEDRDDTNFTAPAILIEAIVCNLIRQLLRSPSNPYVSVGKDPIDVEVEASSENHHLCRKDTMDMLIDCGVAIPHPDDESSIRLSDYQA
jgi:hypothetical protein